MKTNHISQSCGNKLNSSIWLQHPAFPNLIQTNRIFQSNDNTFGPRSLVKKEQTLLDLHSNCIPARRTCLDALPLELPDPAFWCFMRPSQSHLFANMYGFVASVLSFQFLHGSWSYIIGSKLILFFVPRPRYFELVFDFFYTLIIR